MPLYEFECIDHGIFELLLPIVCYNLDMAGCSTKGCRRIAKRVFSVCNVQPDTMWSGVKTDHGYFTSKSQYLNNLREKNIEILTSRSELENVRKNVVKAKIAKKEKIKNNLLKHLTNELKGVTIDSDGNTLKEQNKFIKARK